MRTLTLWALLVWVLGNTVSAKDYKLYYLGGQSNMDGYGSNKDLPEELTGRSAVWVFHGNHAADGQPVDGRGIWAALQPGHGAGFTSDGKENHYSDRFGVELSFAHRLGELDPDSGIALLKYSRGGTSIDLGVRSFGTWDPDFDGGENEGKGINNYDHFLAAVRHALSVDDIDGDGEEDRLIPAGIIWMQGESDALGSPEVALRYEANLRRLMNLVRAALRHDDLPVVIGRISDSGQDEDGAVWDFGGAVRAAQQAFVETDGHAALVTSTDGYGYSDPYHYDSAGFIDLGRRFAEAVFGLQKR